MVRQSGLQTNFFHLHPGTILNDNLNRPKVNVNRPKINILFLFLLLSFIAVS